MRPSEVLDPKRIQAARNAVGLTQKETAELVFPNSRGKTTIVSYQRIERTGKTSPKTAVKIAQCLKVTVDDLRLNEDWANTLLWISHEEVVDGESQDGKRPEIGATHSSVGLCWELDQIHKEYPLKFDQYGQWKIHGSCDFDGAKFHIGISRRWPRPGHESEEVATFYSITIRFCIFDEAKGLFWFKPIEYFSNLIKQQIKSFLFSKTDAVVMNGQAFPPSGVTPCYFIEAGKGIQDEGTVVILSGKKSIIGRYKFIQSLKEWLQNNPGAVIQKTANGLLIKPSPGLKAARPTANEPLEIYHEMSVRYGWLDSQTEVFEEMPWPDYDRANLVVREFICLSPDWPGENDDVEVPIFVPELTERREK